MNAYLHFAEEKDAIIDFDDLLISTAIRAATQDEIDNNEICTYPTNPKR